MARVINLIVIHCSDSPDSKPIGFKEIDQWHKERGFKAHFGVYCGYHYVIPKSGKVQLGRTENTIGAHVKGHNETSIGICWVGQKTCTVQQEHAMFALIKSILERYKLTVDAVLGHKELNPGKTCPNLDMIQFRKRLREFLGHKEESWEKFLA